MMVIFGNATKPALDDILPATRVEMPAPPVLALSVPVADNVKLAPMAIAARFPATVPALPNRLDAAIVPCATVTVGPDGLVMTIFEPAAIVATPLPPVALNVPRAESDKLAPIAIFVPAAATVPGLPNKLVAAIVVVPPVAFNVPPAVRLKFVPMAMLPPVAPTVPELPNRLDAARVPKLANGNNPDTSAARSTLPNVGGPEAFPCRTVVAVPRLPSGATAAVPAPSKSALAVSDVMELLIVPDVVIVLLARNGPA